MLKKMSALEIPSDELRFIEPGPRDRLLLDMLSEYQKRYPSLKPILFYKNMNPSIMVDYMICFEYVDTAHNNVNMVLIDMPFISTERSAPGYRYCKRENKLNEFFEDALKFVLPMLKTRFYEFITDILKLDLKDVESPKYWKKQENIELIIAGLIDISMRRNMEDPTKSFNPNPKMPHVIESINNMKNNGEI